TEEKRVSYPEFHQLPGKGLLFFYRDGGSGNGNLVMNSYDARQKKWKRVQKNLLDGEGKRNAYWQAHVNNKGFIYLSWVWRETPDVASNHDLCFALSKDGGISWERSTGEKYALPITAASAEYACRIPPQSELINQTSMYADDQNNIVIAGYWKDADSNIPQYHLIYNQGESWKVKTLNFRKTPFSLNGTGSKKIPIARPQVIMENQNNKLKVWMIFRDEELGSKVSAAIIPDVTKEQFSLIDLFPQTVGAWEPSFDIGLWNRKKMVSLFVQHTEQADGEGLTSLPPQMVYVLDWKPQ
ncbi:MAG: neuraminidase, partial [Chitinophagaceae bacterium]